MDLKTPGTSSESQQALSSLASYPLLDALIKRRSRRFGKGFNLNGGPLAYASSGSPQPLTLEEEAALAFAACGVTGYALGELPYQTGPEFEAGSGNMIVRFLGRTVASGDALHIVTVFVINDEGAWMLKRPQDFSPGEFAAVADAARDQRLVEHYERSRVQIADKRVDIPRETRYLPPFNKWSANLPGTTYFVPVGELTALFINVLLTAFSDEFRYFIVDERKRFRPAGLGPFARSKGGHLEDDPSKGRAGTISFVETWLCEFTAIEHGQILQNLGLMTQALGLGGFPHFAAHPFIWPQVLGFRMRNVPFSRTIGAGPLTRRLLRALNRDLPLPTAVGLERDGKTLIKPFCPPYYRNMEEAVLAFVDYKYGGGSGTLRDGGEATAWKEGAKIQEGIPRYSDKTIEATIAYCNYVYKNYGRFPANGGPFRTILAYQAHHLDTEFYERFYHPDALSETQREHQAAWHAQ